LSAAGTPRERFDTVIIGAGMSGLAAGIRLAQYDQRVLILEKHYLWGGLNSFYKLGGHRLDVGLHALTNYVPKGTKGTPLARILRQLRFGHADLALGEQLGSEVVFPGNRLRWTNGLGLLHEEVAREFPEVDLVVMPNSDYGACETFNIGFATAHSDHVAILDDDVILPPEWLEKVLARMQAEPETTAIVSTKVVEPGMPESYRNSESANRERYMSTFRGCASLARKQALSEAGGYDERLFIYGNERDLTCRLLNLGYRVLQYPGVETFHKTPFGVQMGKRSLYYHARNAWIGMLKYAPVEDLVRLPWLVLTKVLLRKGKAEAEGAVSDAVGTIGIGKSIRETRGSSWILLKALGSVIYNIPYCLRRREACRAPDFELPLH